MEDVPALLAALERETINREAVQRVLAVVTEDRDGLLSARPECVEAAMAGYEDGLCGSHKQRIRHALEDAERAAGGEV